jgi:hypothetical protein
VLRGLEAKEDRSGPHRLHQRYDPDDLHRAFQVVGQNVRPPPAPAGRSPTRKARRRIAWRTPGMRAPIEDTAQSAAALAGAAQTRACAGGLP